MKHQRLASAFVRPREAVSSATAVEYGVIAVAACAVLAAVIFFFGPDIARAFSDFRTSIAAWR